MWISGINERNFVAHLLNHSRERFRPEPRQCRQGVGAWPKNDRIGLRNLCFVDVQALEEFIAHKISSLIMGVEAEDSKTCRNTDLEMTRTPSMLTQVPTAFTWVGNNATLHSTPCCTQRKAASIILSSNTDPSRVAQSR